MIRSSFVTLAVFLVLAQNAHAAAEIVRSAGSGPWSAAATWDGGRVPAAGAKVLIRAGHTVVYDVKSKAVMRSVHVGGALTFAPDRDTELNVGLLKIQPGENMEEEGFDCVDHSKTSSGNRLPGFSAPCLCCDGKPALLVGTPEHPIEAGHSARIRLHYLDGMNRDSCPAIVCCGGRLDFHGTPLSRTWVKLGASITAPRKKSERSAAIPVQAEITLAEAVAGWRKGDRLLITAGAHYGLKSRTEERFLSSIDGNRLALDKPLDAGHLAEGEHRAEVANLSRNVIVESADPDGIRGHTMYHRGSAGSISYAEFRYLGKKGVLGRYSLHYHLCGDTMRGSSIVGASIWDSHNRWLTIHGTNYLVVRDCIGHRSVGHGFYLEDGTEVYNVLDRNLAVQALAGEPLPRQMLAFDRNEGAGFWWANSHNTFTHNVAVECDRYGFRFEATPKRGRESFNLVLPVRQADGSRRDVDIRTLPFIRFERNEAHDQREYGVNLGEDNGGVGPDSKTPFLLTNTKIWNVNKGFTVHSPSVRIDGLSIDQATYAIYRSHFRAQDWRRVAISNVRGIDRVATREEYQRVLLTHGNTNRVRQPGWPAGKGDGGAQYAGAVEVARIDSADQAPPATVITSVHREGDSWIIRGTTSDNGKVKRVLVNDTEARTKGPNFAEWEVTLKNAGDDPLKLTALAEDEAGNRERTPHQILIRTK